MLDKLFGETVDSDHGKVFLPLLFCIILCSSTLFFFDKKSFHLFGVPIVMSVGLIFFPLTFTITNLIQHRYGRLFANTVVRYGFIADAILVTIGYILIHVGDRQDYFSVYHQIPSIMIATFFFVWMSNFLNVNIFEKMKNSPSFVKFFVASAVAETSVSAISVPLLMFENHLHGNAIYSVLFIAAYKMTVTFVMAVIISSRMTPQTHHQERDRIPS